MDRYSIPVLAYLHPRLFRPDATVLAEAKIDPGQPLIVLRRTAHSAHDLGHHRPSDNEILQAIGRLSRAGGVVLVSEQALPPSLTPFRCPAPIERVHDLLTLASLCIGDGATMAAEAAVLGTPSTYHGPLMTGYLQALRDRYGLLFTAVCLADAVTESEGLLRQPDLRTRLEAHRQRLIDESENIVEFMYGLCERAAKDSSIRPQRLAGSGNSR